MTSRTGYWSRPLSNGQRIAVSQQTQVRDEIARESALRAMLPWLIVVPVLLLVVADLVRKMLRPVTILAHEVYGRGEQDLHPLPAEKPALRAPSVRHGHQSAAQPGAAGDGRAASVRGRRRARIALADDRLVAAGRTARGCGKCPSRRANAPPRSDRGSSVAVICSTSCSVFARAQGRATAPVGKIAVMATCRRVLEDLLPLAEAKGIDLGMQPGTDASPLDERDGLEPPSSATWSTTPSDTHRRAVESTYPSRKTAQHVVLRVEDNGPGIPENERQRVLDPFYRVLGTEQSGSGLGLSHRKAGSGAHERMPHAGRLLKLRAWPFGHCPPVQVIPNVRRWNWLHEDMMPPIGRICAARGRALARMRGLCLLRSSLEDKSLAGKESLEWSIVWQSATR